METKIRTNNVILNAVVPSYVTLVSKDLQTYMTCVTFPIKEYAQEWFSTHKDKLMNSKNAELITFAKRNKRGSYIYRVSIRRTFNRLLDAHNAAWTICAKDKDRLKIWMREADIAQKRREIDSISAFTGPLF